ncbi:hypothetical protein SAMN04488028_1011046 [Reichenbachiella agariperforans]|uniref:Cyclic nucleotide-binding domain-containing protein n=1 Tax=Reichenbachiella agariperforans TaxID=156994 RepID=A0A1M6LPF4_REIAG|nr:cyclic nucleotide-binding domain-containing protein [Reichenbachiella agariperforans]SHJ73079.1 hypothetical protein SAMN04488028_1011046 [Reichenbachiella agariperforans]
MFNFYKKSSAKNLESVFAKAEKFTYNKGELLAVQFEKTHYYFMLQEGEVSVFSTMGGDHKKRIELGRYSALNSPLGLDVINEPYRYDSSIEAVSDKVTVLRWNQKTLNAFLDKNIDLAMLFYEHINTNALSLIKESSYLFANTAMITKNNDTTQKASKGYDSPLGFDEDEMVVFLLQSPFFEVFEEEDLRALSKHISRKQYKVGKIIDLQDEVSKGINILRVGDIRFSRFNGEGDERYKVSLRAISTPGYLLGPSGFLGAENVMTTRAKKDSVILHLPYDALKNQSKKRPEFGLKLQKRVSWLLNNQLRGLRARLISAQFNEEVTVSTNLIESNRASLALSSPLHKVPHLLSFKHTIPDGLSILHHVELNGGGIEKNIASLCLDNLHDTQREVNFYENLQDIYNTVISAPAIMMADKVHKECIKLSKTTFDQVATYVKGKENIPETPGNLFVYNHLLNPPYYALPNQFQINLDCHFLSTIVADAYNEEVVMKIVRSGREIEHGHQSYYERLGYINAYSEESENSDSFEKNERVSDQIEEFLTEFNNVIIGPENTSYTTDQSPGVFNADVFERILEMEREPLIVPVVMANFDQRIRNNKFACEIKEPFLLSEKMKEMNIDNVKSFLVNYRKEFKTYVKALQEEAS